MRILPLNWIYVDAKREGTGTTADLFEFFRNNLEKLSGSLLPDVIFQAFWKEQQQLIQRMIFYPYVVFFIVSNIYYLEIMHQDIIEFDPDQIEN